MAKRKEKGMQRLQAFQNKKRSEELAMGMIARNEALDQLGLKVNEEEIMSEHFLAFSAPLIIWVSISLAVARKPGRPPTGRTPSEGGRAEPPCERESTPCGADWCRSRARTCTRAERNESLETAPRKRNFVCRIEGALIGIRLKDFAEWTEVDGDA